MTSLGSLEARVCHLEAELARHTEIISTQRRNIDYLLRKIDNPRVEDCNFAPIPSNSWISSSASSTSTNIPAVRKRKSAKRDRNIDFGPYATADREVDNTDLPNSSKRTRSMSPDVSELPRTDSSRNNVATQRPPASTASTALLQRSAPLSSSSLTSSSSSTITYPSASLSSALHSSPRFEWREGRCDTSHAGKSVTATAEGAARSTRFDNDQMNIQPRRHVLPVNVNHNTNSSAPDHNNLSSFDASAARLHTHSHSTHSNSLAHNRYDLQQSSSPAFNAYEQSSSYAQPAHSNTYTAPPRAPPLPPPPPPPLHLSSSLSTSCASNKTAVPGAGSLSSSHAAAQSADCTVAWLRSLDMHESRAMAALQLLERLQAGDSAGLHRLLAEGGRDVLVRWLREECPDLQRHASSAVLCTHVATLLEQACWSDQAVVLHRYDKLLRTIYKVVANKPNEQSMVLCALLKRIWPIHRQKFKDLCPNQHDNND